MFHCCYVDISYVFNTVEPFNADTFGTKLNCPDYRGVHLSGVFVENIYFQTNIALCMITFRGADQYIIMVSRLGPLQTIWIYTMSTFQGVRIEGFHCCVQCVSPSFSSNLV